MYNHMPQTDILHLLQQYRNVTLQSF